MRLRTLWLVSTIVVVALLACSDDDDGGRDVVTPGPVTDLRERFGLKPLPEVVYPIDNPPTQERIALGRLLFYDPILSGERDVACGTCHHPAFAFADRRQFGAGVSGSGLGPDRIVGLSAMSGLEVTLEPRNTPTVFNAAFNEDENGEFSSLGFQFWDGRVQGLEVQATKPITSRVEMRGDAYPGDDVAAAAVALDSVLARLRAIPEYETRFRHAFPAEAERGQASAIDSSRYARAIAAFERELVTRNSPFDRYVDGDDEALSEIQKAGLELFFTKAKCATCHVGPMFGTSAFIVQGVPQEGVGKSVIPGDDTGREEATLNPAHRYGFRTPTIRNAELTPPYMHDGVFETLEQVIHFYNDGSFPRHPAVTDSMLDPRLRAPLGLTDDEIRQLVAFIKSLTDPGTALDPFLLSVPERVPSGLMPLFGVLGVGSGRTAVD